METLIKRLFFILLLAELLAACAPAKMPTPDSPAVLIENPYAPQPADKTLQRDTVEMVKTEMAVLNSNPRQVGLTLSFFTPTPCHQFRINMDQPGADKHINVEVYSLREQAVCTLMRLNTPTVASLSLKGLPSGHYTVWVNGEKALEFDV